MGAATILVLSLLAFPDETSRNAAQKRRAADEITNITPAKQRAERYDPIPLEGNLDSFLKQLLLNADEQEELGKLFEQLGQLPQVDAKLLEQLKALEKNPWKRAELVEQARKLNAGGALSADDLKHLQKWIESWRASATNHDTSNYIPPARSDLALPPPAPTADDRLARWAKDMLKNVDNSRAGDFLRDSPAWKNGLRDLDKVVKASDFKFDWLRGRMPESLKLPKSWTPKVGDWIARLPSVQSLPRWRFSAPNVGRFNVNLGGSGGGGFGAPSLGGAAVSDNFFWLLVPLLLALLAWFFYRNLGRAPAFAAAGRNRGPWPVDPGAVTTRGQLIQAFDYLALLLLGDQVRTWNHVAVSKKLGEQAARNPAAGALAQLYELARYTPGDDTLPPDARDAARRHLLYLARSAAA